MISYPFLRQAGPALGFGFLLAFGSSVGQTYFISLFAGEMRAELDLSHGDFGGLYTLATMASAGMLVWLGKFADRFDLVGLSILTLAILAGVALLMAGIQSALWLTIALFGLRLGGQGMLSHLAITAMGRWFTQQRGRALSVAMLGFPMGEALFPALVALLLGLLSWRQVWVGAALGLALFIMPMLLWLGRQVRQRGLDRPDPQLSQKEGKQTVSWSRQQVLRDGRFYGLLPGLLAPPFIITGVLFHQIHLVETKAWTLTEFTAFYPLYAGSATAVALGLGWLVDRYSASQILPFYLLPLGIGLSLLSISDELLVAGMFMALMGCTAGGATIVLGALWAELYGTVHLGAIRALAMALLVLATALAPGAMGWLIDLGISLDLQFRLLAVYTVVCSLGFGLLLPCLSRQRIPSGLVSR
jgi:MFS family permease